MLLSATVPTAPAHPDVVVPFVQAALDALPTIRIWMGQSYAAETTAVFSYLAGTGLRPAVGTCVTVAPLQHPVRAALDARTLAVVSGTTPILGIGAGPDRLRTRLGTVGWEHPVAASADYVLAVRAALSQFDHDSDGQPLLVDEAPEFDSTLYPIPSSPVLIGLGVLRPAMARAAGRVADAAIMWMCPPTRLGEVLGPELDRAAVAAGRPTPRKVVMLSAAVARPGRDTVALLHHGVGGHLQLPHYRAMAQDSGVDVHTGYAEQLNSAREHHLAVVGPLDAIVEELEALRANGADEVVLHLSGVTTAYGLGEAARDLADILDVAGPVFEEKL